MNQISSCGAANAKQMSVSKYNVKHLRRSAESSGGTRLEFVISAKEFNFLTQHWVDFT
jgi:hypothetical protein